MVLLRPFTSQSRKEMGKVAVNKEYLKDKGKLVCAVVIVLILIRIDKKRINVYSSYVLSNKKLLLNTYEE